MKIVTIRFANPRNAAKNMDHDAMQADLQARLEVLIWERLGDDVELRLTRGETNDIRIDGKFIEKPLEVKRVVSEALGEIMEDFDSSAYTL